MSLFFGVLTSVGRAKLAAAIQRGEVVELPMMSIGDGAGVVVTPSASQTSLVREVYRAPTNSISISTAEADVLIGELVVPVAEGGFVVREYGWWDADGDLFAVGNFPASYKPLPAEGATQDMVIRCHVKFSGTEHIQLQVNPSVVIASRQWVIDNFLPVTPGTVGQFLRKRSNQPTDIEWVNLDLEGIDIQFDTKMEMQDLAAAQTIVNFNEITTSNAGFYVDGQRLFPAVHYTVTGDAQITLTSGATAGQKILGVQNDQTSGVNDATEALRGLTRYAGDAATLAGLSRVLAVSPATLKLALAEAGFVKKASNLSDLANAVTARANLGLKGGATADIGTGTGNVLPHNAYGLGGHGTQLTQAHDLNNVRAFGWYRWGSGTTAPANSPIAQAGVLLVEPYSTSSQWAKQTVVTLASGANIRRFWRLLPNNINAGADWKEDLDVSMAGETGLILFKSATAAAARTVIGAVAKGENGLLSPVVIPQSANLNAYKEHGWYYHSSPRPTNAPLNEAGYLDVTPWGAGSERVRQVWTGATTGREFVRVITESAVGTWQERNFRADNFFLQRLNNLSDIPNKPAALENLGLTPFLPKAIAIFAGRPISGEVAHLYFNYSIPANSTEMTLTREIGGGIFGLSYMTPTPPASDSLGVRYAKTNSLGGSVVDPAYGLTGFTGQFLAGHRIRIVRSSGNGPASLEEKVTSSTLTTQQYTGTDIYTIKVPVSRSSSARNGLCYIPLCIKKSAMKVETIVRRSEGQYVVNFSAGTFSSDNSVTRYIVPVVPQTAHQGNDGFVTTIDHLPITGTSLEGMSACIRVERLSDQVADAVIGGAHFYEQV